MSPARLLQLAFVVIASISVYCFVSAARDGERRRACTAVCAVRPDYAGFNRTAPDFELPNIDGTTFRLSQQRGKVVILNFWTKSCRPCLEEMPDLAEFAEVIKGRTDKVIMVAVSTDETANDVRDTLNSILKGKAPSFVTLVDSENAVVREKYGTKLYPETWYIDPQGVIRARFDGPRDWGSALYLDLAEDLLKKSTSCPAEMETGKTLGVTAQLCADLPLLGG
jgi:peroxiredoxin